MRTASSLFVLLLLSPLAISQAPPSGFEALFNGKDLAGWRGRPHLDPRKEAAWTPAERAQKQASWDQDMRKHWSVSEGELVNDGHGVFLSTAKDYEDFELLLDYKTVALADSGIYLRACPQVQIWDTREAGGKWKLGADKGSGALWNNQKHERFPLVHADRPFGEWNHLRILIVGSRVSVWLNGQLTVDHVIMENYFDRSLPLFRKGPVQLQTHGGEISFRRLAIRNIGSAEANAWLSSHGSDGFESIFNGKNLDGWAGATEHYVVVDGAIRCRPRHGGNLFTKEQYGDFSARLEIKLPPGGNNGLAIRFPGQGNPAYDGMCELQVLDNGAPKYQNLKPWQFHASAYGMVPAKRGYQRPQGEWNFQEVRVVGSKIFVELNGTPVLDTDLAEISSEAILKKHPGLRRKKGHFGFAGHNDPVMFRRIAIKH